jgi:hypothetical protein
VRRKNSRVAPVAYQQRGTLPDLNIQFRSPLVGAWNVSVCWNLTFLAADLLMMVKTGGSTARANP